MAKKHPLRVHPLDVLSYGGVRLPYLIRSCSDLPRADRYCFEVEVFVHEVSDLRALAAILVKSGGVIRGLRDGGGDALPPLRVVSLCFVHWAPDLGRAVWGFWVQSLSEWEAVREDLAEIAEGGRV